MVYKGLKFLVDVGVGKIVEEWLKDNGYDVKSIRDINPRMEDREILKIAVDEDRMIITMDKDFGELVYKSGLLHSGVLILRLEDARANEKVSIVKEIVHKYGVKMQHRFCVFQNGRLRIRIQ